MLDADDDRPLGGLDDDLDDGDIHLRPFDASSVRSAINDLEDVFSSSGPTDFRDLEAGDDDRGALLGKGGNRSSDTSSSAGSGTSAEASSNAQTPFSWYELGYYQRFFDIRTTDVLARIVDALLLRPFRHDVDTKPDLYGPFWIATTVIVLVAATANFASYLRQSSREDTAGAVWRYDFDIMTQAAVVFYSMVSAVPALVWASLLYLRIPKRLVSVVSVYGYSLASFVPATFVCAVAAAGLRWLVVLSCFGLSSVFLVRNLWILIDLDDGIDRSSTKQRQHSYMLIVGVVAAQLVLSLLVEMWFFSAAEL